ncbi:MAG: Formate dehydrogenase subunit alpha FdhA [Candidatus Methanohalarchaeum thermophilum]|uniref:Formate dehydrogenase subunit alpha FdhA n=1 Tax=Methanohalarchaeum thermophilum TaxID=1903181 RepID=A0A1Q6DWB4_METT1|nr:MAG: Formate dehydrogenase subunit alpha FdhA [Candidatus Methanohalarchaeum thermophilum]
MTSAAGLASYYSSREMVEGPIGEVNASPESEEKLVPTICSFCAIGCGFKARVKDGELVGQEPWYDNPINQGGQCSKGQASIQEAKNEKRIKHPLKKVDGEWQRVTWDEALTEISNQLQDYREESGPDSVYWMGSAKMSNEESYMFRKLAAFWGTNNVDHQARICHSTTVAGLANTWGYGAQTNHSNDIQNTDCAFFIGSNAAECHPALMKNVLKAKENGAKVVVADPRRTKTASKADLYVPFRSGTDVPLLMYVLKRAIESDSYDKKMVEERTYGFAALQEAVKDYDLETVHNITGTPKDKLKELAEVLISNSGSAGPMTLIYSMGSTQHSNGAQNTRLYCILQLVLGNAATPGGGVNALRGHDNVQGATDMCILSHTLPAYYGLSESAWKHWCRVWDVDYDWMKSRFENQELMGKPGFTVARWFEGVLKDPEEIDQPNNLRAIFVWGHSLNSVSEMVREKKALDEIDLAVVVDPYPSAAAALSDRDNNLYVLPAATRFESEGSVTNSGRQQQWRFKPVDPYYNSKTDKEIMIELAKKLGFGDKFTKNIDGDWTELPEDITREINKGARTIQMSGGTPEILKGHMKNAGDFDTTTLRAEGGPYDGDYWGKPWPCWNEDHPGTPILYRNDIPVSEGGHDVRVRWGPESPDKQSIEEGLNDQMKDIVEPVSKELANQTMLSGQNGHDQLTERYNNNHWAYDLETDYKQAVENNLVPSGRGRARIYVWSWANDGGDGVPVHREPINSPEPGLIEEWPTYEDLDNQYRVKTEFKSAQQERKNDSEDYPFVLTTGRVVEHMGGGGATRQEWWLVERSPEVYVEINPSDANDLDIENDDWVWVKSKEGKAKVKAKVTPRPMEGLVFIPYHWFGYFQGEDRTDEYPEGSVPYGIGEPANGVTNYGYAWTTQMQETKAGLCSVEKASDQSAPGEKGFSWDEENNRIG